MATFRNQWGRRVWQISRRFVLCTTRKMLAWQPGHTRRSSCVLEQTRTLCCKWKKEEQAAVALDQWSFDTWRCWTSRFVVGRSLLVPDPNHLHSLHLSTVTREKKGQDEWPLLRTLPPLPRRPELVVVPGGRCLAPRPGLSGQVDISGAVFHRYLLRHWRLAMILLHWSSPNVWTAFEGRMYPSWLPR